jgi:predicted AlkP superfamily phosphohydrolase/phosphomutase
LKDLDRSIGVIGFDGLSSKYMSKMINSGLMPYFKHLVIRSDLNVNIHCYPPATPSSWPSLMSGVNLGKHGIYDFYKIDNGEIRLFTTLDLGHPRIHEMLAMYKINVLMINPVPSYPIIPVSNTMHTISLTFFTPKPIGYPEILEEYAKHYKQFKYGSLNDFFESYISDLDFRLTLLEELLEKNSYKLVWINFEVPDRILHLASEAGRYDILEKDILDHERKLFKKLDEFFKILSKAMDNLAVVSDHGFAYYDKAIALNTLFYRQGIVKPSVKGLASEEEKELQKVLLKKKSPHKFISMNNPLIKIARSSALKPFTKLLIHVYKVMFGKEIKIRFPEVDHKSSKAYLLSELSSAVIINNKDQSLAEYIKGIISDLNGIKHVWFREEIFSGPYLNKLPNIYVYPEYDKGYWIVNSKIYDKIYHKRPRLHHHPLGIFVMKDIGGIRIRGYVLNNTVVAPIIMNWLNTPLSSWIDDKEFIERVFSRNIRYTDKYIKLWRLSKRIFYMKSKGVKQ